jgi:protein SDA1
VKNQLKAKVKGQKKRELALAGEDPLNEVENDVLQSKKLYPAIELLHDPQGLAEVAFRNLKKSNSSGSYKFEVKLLMMNFVTRLVGNHELMVLPLYPFLQKYMSGTQRDVTAILAYSVQACHQFVPPDEIYGLLKTLAHNFITERCSGEQMAVGINAARAICARCPSVMNSDEETKQDLEGNEAGNNTNNRNTMDMEGFAQDLAAYSKHRDQSVRVAGKGWMNFVREVYPTLLAGKDRGTHGSALHRAGEKPLKYGEQQVAMGVKGADLLAEYERKKALQKESRLAQGGNDDDGSESDGWVDMEEDGEDDGDEGEWEEVGGEEGEDADAGSEKVGDEEEEDDDSDAPDLVNLEEEKMSKEERDKLQQDTSSTRIFTTSDFEKMRKLVARAERDKRDPRAAARRKRAEANGESLEELSDDYDESDVDSEDEGPRIAGRVHPDEIMAEAKRKRQSKAEKLEKIVAGRDKFAHKQRAGSSTNTEKARKKNFLMQKFSRTMRAKKDLKETAIVANKRKSKLKGLTHEAKKRRRKL